MFRKKKETKKKSKVKAGESLCFYEKEELEVIKNTVTHRGIANYCCKEMEKACEPFKTKEHKRYEKDEFVIAKSELYDKKTNKIGIHTHSAYNFDSCGDGTDYYNQVEFKYCPFCGTKINGYI